MLYTHILVPTDFSPAANQVLAYAFEEATQHHARLTLLHVLHHHPATEVYYVRGAPESRTGLVAEFGGTVPTTRPSPPETIRRDYNEEALLQLSERIQSQGDEVRTERIRATSYRGVGCGRSNGRHQRAQHKWVGLVDGPSL